VLQEGSRAGVGGQRERVRAALVVAAVALSVALSIASGLLVRALWQLRSLDPGFRIEHAIAMTTTLNMSQNQKTARREQFYDRILGEVRGLPGVSAAGYTSFLPMAFKGGVFPVVPEGESPEDSKRRQASLRFVTAGYVPAMGIKLTRGRDIVDSDGPSSPRVALVSESFARQFWPDRDAIGRHFVIAEQDRTVVGIVGDVRVRGLEMASEPQVYLPSRQMPDAYFMFFMPRQLVIRTSLDAASLTPMVRQIVTRVDPQLPVTDVRTLADLLDQETGPRTVQVRVLGVFAAVAFLLAGIGIHGLLSFAVSHRAQEIGVRMAMGAQMRDILRMILGESLMLATIGIAAGALLAYILARTMEALLAGVSPRDPWTFVVAVSVAFVMTLAGSALPAVRAVRVDPMSVIRAD